MINYLTYTKEETARTIESLHQERVSDFVSIVRAQHEGAINDWWDCFCVDCDRNEVFQGTIWEFAEKLATSKWGIESLELFTAVCPACQNPTDNSTWASQYQDNQGLLG